MTVKTISRGRAAAFLVAGAVLPALGPSRVWAQAPAPLRIATLPVETAAEVVYAKEMGFFTKAGIDADVQTMQATSGVAAALASGAIDVGYTTVDVLAAIHVKNVPLVAIAPAAEYVYPATARTGAIVVAPASPVQKAKDLNGRTVATSGLHSLSQTVVMNWIDQNGGDSSTVKFVEIPFPAMPAALDAGRVEAVWLPEPFLTIATKTDRVLAYAYEAISKHFLLGAWIATPQWAADHPDLVRRFAAAVRATADWANKNPADSGKILAAQTKGDPAVIAAMARVRYSEELTAATLQPLIDASAKYNSFKAFPAQELIFTASR